MTKLEHNQTDFRNVIVGNPRVVEGGKFQVYIISFLDAINKNNTGNTRPTRSLEKS